MNYIKILFWNAPEIRLRAGWRLAIQLSLNIGLALLLLKLIAAYTGTIEAQSSWFEVLVYSVLLSVTLFSVWFAGRFLDRRKFSDFGMHLNCHVWWADFACGLVLGAVLPVGLALVAVVIGWVTFEPVFMAGIAGVSFPLAVLIMIFQYTSIGMFEELARAYHIRNLFEGLNTSWFGPKVAAVAAMMGASAISAMMHRGNLVFLIFVFVDTLVYALSYLLTGRMAIALAHHIAWDFVVAVVLGVGASEAHAATAFFVARMGSNGQGSSDNIGFIILAGVGFLGYELANLLLMLGWVRWRYGRIRLNDSLARPTLRPRRNR